MSTFSALTPTPAVSDPAPEPPVILLVAAAALVVVAVTPPAGDRRT